MRSPRFRSTALAILMVHAIGACTTSAATPAASPSPPASATDVLTAYLTALKAGDCDRAHTFAAPTFVISNGELCGAVHVSAFTPLLGPTTNPDGVTFSTDLTTDGDGVSIRPGELMWFYSLARQPDGTWLLIGGGSGP